jgi:hypothetical protein
MTAQPANSFQQSINIYTAFGVPGEISFDGPIRSKMYNLFSNGTPNIVGYAYTISQGDNPDPAGDTPNAGNATVGGTGVFAGILVNPKAYVNFGTTAQGPLGPTLALPDYTLGELMDFGECFASLPGPANPGDLVCYNTTTGALSSIPAVVSFTASVVVGGSAGVNDTLHVSAITAGSIQIGMLVTGAGVAGGTYIASFGTGIGGTGIYNLSSINEQTVSSEAMTGNGLPVPGFTGNASSAGTTLTVGTASTGKLVPGTVITGTGFAAGTVITAFGTGEGGTGTYTINISQTVSSTAITGQSTAVLPRTVVGLFGNQTLGGVCSIKVGN